MVEYIYLKPGEQMPEMADEDAWLVVEASDDDRFFGSGYGFKASGEGVFYASLPKSDLSLESAQNSGPQSIRFPAYGCKQRPISIVR